ncbi:putative O-antigen polymerase [Planktothrix agardhii]|uniref:O-antigen ligase family protein n=2 Tax=Planktothrix agardhii TaxID=1160 RepID=UPI001BA244AA|nr:O-antigen ligase [Planktothrix agardhii]CAD0227944.1 putative O-antigen polymerase [Planktothrix agardhii]
MNPGLNFFEKRFAIFSYLFLTGVFRFASFYTSPDAASDAAPSYNPFDKVSSLLQQIVYLTSFFFLVSRPKGSARAAIRDPWVWMLALMTLFSFLWSDYPAISRRKGITTLQTTYLGLYISSRFTMKQQLQMLCWAFGIITVFSLLFSLAFRGVAVETGANPGSWRGPFTQKNLLARLMVLAAIIFILIALDKPKHYKLAWGLFGNAVLLILLTGSKTALLLFLTILMLVPLYALLRKKDTILIPILVSAVLIGGNSLIFITENWIELLAALGRDSTLSGRTILWEIAIEKIKQRYWLGYGYQGFWLDGGGAEVIWKHEGYKPPHAHNGFVNISLDLGVLGLIIFLTIIIVTYARGIIWLRAGNTWAELWPVCYVTFFFMYNHTESTIIEHNSIFWVLLVSVSLSMKQVKPKRNRPLPPDVYLIDKKVKQNSE